ncbi:lipase-like domain-containing protein [Staphylococcus aureus]
MITGNLIGKATEKESGEKRWFSAPLFLLSIHLIELIQMRQDKIQKGIWQVTPTKHDWDHVDFVGQDEFDRFGTRETTRFLASFSRRFSEN